MTRTTSRLLLGSVLLGVLGFAACSDDSSSTTAGTGSTTATGIGGAAAANTAVATGSTTSTASGSATASGGSAVVSTAATGGSSTASTAATCGTTTSTVSETWDFSGTSAPGAWMINTGAPQAGATLTYGNTSPISGDTGTYAKLAVTIPAGAGWGASTIIDNWFADSTNLYGSTITATVVLKVISGDAANVAVQLFTQGDDASEFAWGTTTIADSATIVSTSSWQTIQVSPVNAGDYCASGSKAVGVMVQRQSEDTTTQLPASTVELYIKSVVIDAGSGSGGSGGSTSTGTSTSGGAGGSGGTGTTGTT